MDGAGQQTRARLDLALCLDSNVFLELWWPYLSNAHQLMASPSCATLAGSEASPA